MKCNGQDGFLGQAMGTILTDLVIASVVSMLILIADRIYPVADRKTM
jgi:hypothetical protein